MFFFIYPPKLEVKCDMPRKWGSGVVYVMVYAVYPPGKVKDLRIPT